jgi:hypothetical protein
MSKSLRGAGESRRSSVHRQALQLQSISGNRPPTEITAIA